MNRLKLGMILGCLASTLVLQAGEIGSQALPPSFLPLHEVELPSVKDSSWPAGRLDHFILARLETEGLRPAAEAEDRILLRRLSYDLKGLPPTWEDWVTFRQRRQMDPEQAWRDQVDEWLASPAYGERWARHWLDLARYTDRTASWLNSTAAAWRYRDWVVRALNEDMPYDEFVRKQLANDLIPGSDPRENVALGFLGLSPNYWKELQLPPEVIKTTVADEWEERMDAVGRTFLGLTLGCARCHDHKSDPITQADYYALAGVFASVRITDRTTLPEDLWKPVSQARQKVARLKAEVQVIQKKPKASLKPEDEERIRRLQEEIREIESGTPHYHAPMVSGVDEAALHVNARKDGKQGTTLDYSPGMARDLPIHVRGNPNVTGETMPRGFLSAFATPGREPRRFRQGSGRLELADAFLEDSRGLAARVIVNRVWQHHFGRGLVATPSEMGFSGDAPTHPDLLEDLARRFVENGWSLKWLHREILCSATWRQGLNHPEAARQDPENRWVARRLRQKLDVESWRDGLLRVSGNLEDHMGGDPVPILAPGNHRRTLYGLIHRREMDVFLSQHDFPDPTAHAATRNTTITPLQQLFVLNSDFMLEQARGLALRILAQSDDFESRVRWGYRWLFLREPHSRELDLAKAFLESSEQAGAQDAWALYAQALLGSNEFLFIE